MSKKTHKDIIKFKSYEQLYMHNRDFLLICKGSNHARDVENDIFLSGYSARSIGCLDRMRFISENAMKYQYLGRDNFYFSAWRECCFFDGTSRFTSFYEMMVFDREHGVKPKWIILL